MSDRDNAIRRVRALLALADPSRNPSEGERAAAAAMARKMMAQHGLTDADIRGEVAPKAPDAGLTPDDLAEAMRAWAAEQAHYTVRIDPAPGGVSVRVTIDGNATNSGFTGFIND